MDKYFYTSYWFLLHLWQIKSVLKSRKVTQYYDQQCIKIFLLSSSSLIITQALTSIPVVGNIKEFLHGELPKSLLESYINFSPKLNMEVMLTQSNFRFFRKLVALYFYYKLQSIICTIQKIFWKFILQYIDEKILLTTKPCPKSKMKMFRLYIKSTWRYKWKRKRFLVIIFLRLVINFRSLFSFYFPAA